MALTSVDTSLRESVGAAVLPDAALVLDVDVAPLGALVLTAEEMEELEAAAKKAEEERQRILTDLAISVQNKFDERSSRRQMKEGEWIESMQLYLGALAGGRLLTTEDYFRTGPTTNRRPDHNLVKTKCLTAIAQGISSQFAGGDKNWDIDPPIVAEEGLDPKIAAIKAERMEAIIDDQLTADNYGFKCRSAYFDRVVLGTGIMKGPLPMRDAKLTYDQVIGPDGKPLMVPTHKVSNKPVLFHVDPWMFFPDDTVNCIDDAEDAIELHPFNKMKLRALKKNPGFFAESIDALLQEEPREYRNAALSTYSALSNSGQNVWKDKYCVLEYHGPVTRTQLDTLEICPAYESADETYYGEVWVCQGKVLRVELELIEGLFELPYAVCPWEEDPGSIFGFGLPQSLKDSQRIATQTLHMILDNASGSSGSSVVIDREQIEPADGKWEIGPRKMWLRTDYNDKPVNTAFQFFDIPNQTAQLMPVLQMAREFSQEESGLPSMVAGLDSAQTGSDSATGLAILQQNSTIVADYMAEMWDDAITTKLITRLYHYNLQYNWNPEFMGSDFEVNVKSSTEARNRQLAIRDVEKISVEAAQNPELASMLNMQELQRTRLSMMHLPSGTIVKSDEQIAQEQAEAAANQPPDPAMLEIQLKQQELELKAQQLELDKARLQFEATKEQQREAWQHDERLSANEARMREAEARVIEVQTNREIAMIQLAQKDEVSRAQIMAQLDMANITDQTKRFLAGIAAQQKATEQAQTEEELRIKREVGTGI